MLFTKSKPTDIQQVHMAAVWLGVSEFQVFCDAWQAWYNEKPSEKRIEPYFVDFLGQDAVPFWVRNYIRIILNRKDLFQNEKKRLLIGALTYYIPLLIFFILIMRALL
ncbi:MAG: hypothetical protein WBD61_09715 [Desulfobulbales bacterium]|jgi:hypothetical protein